VTSWLSYTAVVMPRKGPPIPWGYRVLAIFLAVLFIGWMVYVY